MGDTGPRPARLTEAEYRERFAAELGWSDFPASEQSRNVYAFLRSAADLCEEHTIVLDASAGFCRVMPFFQHAQYLGLDSMVGEEEWDFSRLDIVGEALDMPILDDSIDVVLNLVSLEHYNDPFQAFREFTRVLKPGGHLFLDVPCVSHEHQQPHDFFRFTRYALAQLCERNGLEVTSLRPANSIFETALGMMDEALEMLPDAMTRKSLSQMITKHIAPVFAQAAQAEDACVDYPESSPVHQCPWLYLLHARMPGASEPSPVFTKRRELLGQVAACPLCKGPLQWADLQQHCDACDRIFTLRGRTAWLMRDEEDESAAMEKLLHSPEHSGEDIPPEQVAERVREWTRQGKHEEVIRLLRTAIRHNPENPTAWNDLGVAYHNAGDMDNARKCLERAARLDPGKPLALLNLGDLCQSLGRPFDALRAYRDLHAAHPQHREGLLALARLCVRLERHSDAIHAYEELIRDDPGARMELAGQKERHSPAEVAASIGRKLAEMV